MSASSQLVARAGNDALNANPDLFRYPTHSDINITTHGSDIYWAVTAVMALSALIFMGLSFKSDRRGRIFYYLTSSICLVASIAYFTMASNLGYAPIAVEFVRSNPLVRGTYREIFYVRYIDWVITTPLLLTDVLLTAGLPWPTILYTVLIDEVMIVTGLVGALVSSSYKWGYFTFAMVALFFILYQVIHVGRLYAFGIDKAIGRTYMIVGGWTMFLWFLYPIAWGLSEGGNVISPDSEAIFYSILDVLAKPVFGAILLWGHRKIDPERLGLYMRGYDELPRNRYSGQTGRVERGERKTEHDATNTTGVAHNGADATAPIGTHGHSAAGV